MSFRTGMIVVLTVLFGSLALVGCGKKSGESETWKESEEPLGFSGKLTDSNGNAIEGAELNILHEKIKAVSDEKGRYEILWGEKKYLGTVGTQIVARHEGKNLASVVKIKPRTKTKNIILEPAITLTGSITDQDGKAMERVKVRVNYYIDESTGNRVLQGGNSFDLDAGGIYKVALLPQWDKCTIDFEYMWYGSARSEFSGKDAVNGVVKLDPVVMPKADQTVSGIVVDTDGKPVAKASVFAKGVGQPKVGTSTNAKGKFTLKVCKGEPIVHAYTKKGPRMESQEVKVPSGSNNVELVLKLR